MHTQIVCTQFSEMGRTYFIFYIAFANFVRAQCIEMSADASLLYWVRKFRACRRLEKLTSDFKGRAAKAGINKSFWFEFLVLYLRWYKSDMEDIFILRAHAVAKTCARNK